MEAAGSPLKKRKMPGLDPPEAANPAAAAEEERGPEPAAEDQEPPLPGADGGAAKDRISHLPEAVLQDIISLLPTKEGGRTPLLASAWRKLWRSAPLNLDLYRLCQDPKDLDAVVSRILSAHLGPSRRFSAPQFYLHGDRAGPGDAWLWSPALRNLQELELRGFGICRIPLYPPPVPLPLPAAAFRFSETLCVAIIGDCQFPDITDQAIQFPKLKKLFLERVSISESSLHTMITCCLALECLLIAHSQGFHCVRINSISLRSIGVKAYRPREGLRFEELIIENAPCLERLLQFGSVHPHTSVISAPKLETLGWLSSDHGTRLLLGSTVIQGLHVDSLTSKVRTVKILSVDMCALSLDPIIKLMRCFPCLERLYIESAGRGENNVWRRERRVLLKSFDIRLKKISWRYYRGIKSHVDFATFFVANARVLELMIFQVCDKDYCEEYVAKQREMLRLDSKASRGAQFHFTPDDCYSADFRFRDLDLADPFERKDPYEFRALS